MPTLWLSTRVIKGRVEPLTAATAKAAAAKVTTGKATAAKATGTATATGNVKLYHYC